MFLTELCAEIRNYFETEKKFGIFTVNRGTLAPSDFLQEGQFFRIVGSTFNDGVYQFPAVNLIDETFDGAVWAMEVPPNVVALSAKIEDFNEKNVASNYVSESFGGYSYSKATDENGAPMTWQKVFDSDLNKLRKAR
ncbi:MAG: hypothetical protein ACI4JY_08765 [Oscillospiraceae bacterium]